MCILSVKILDPANCYDPKFCPTNGKLIAQYNGNTIILLVVNSVVNIHVESKEGSFDAVIDPPYKGSIPWGMMIDSVCEEISRRMMNAAFMQREYLMSEGLYHVN